jgi:hypothetical protein
LSLTECSVVVVAAAAAAAVVVVGQWCCLSWMMVMVVCRLSDELLVLPWVGVGVLFFARQ